MQEAAPSDTLTQYRLKMIEDTLQQIAANLERLAALEQKHLETRDAVGRAFDTIERIDGRVRHVELEMPTLRLIRGWVIAGVLGTLSLMGLTLAKVFSLTVN